jgi:hypothetical protein
VPGVFAHGRALAVSTSLFVASALSSACGATVDKGSSDASDAKAGNGCPGSQVSLTVKNVESWCTFAINGGKESAAASDTLCIAPGTVTLSATPKPGFELGPEPWHDIDSLNGGTATVVVSSGSKCVWVCCPGSGAGGAPCPESDQCF